MQLPWHPSWISSGSDVLSLSLQDRVVCERYHHSWCMYHIEQISKRKNYVFPYYVWLSCSSSWWPSWILYVP